MKILIINGPNINMLGTREPDKYGVVTYNGLVKMLKEEAQRLDVDVDFFQSNHEGALVDVIQNAYGIVDGIVINPAAYTHTSIAILDALKAVDIPAAEIHITDIAKREEFRHISYAGMACKWHFIGEGLQGYVHGMEAIKQYIEEREKL